ncbi:MAG: hypothetical protein CMN30_10290 [Sandaracinus sp.]|nr:hypothetical protein [Sandaracinus sp.]
MTRRAIALPLLLALACGGTAEVEETEEVVATGGAETPTAAPAEREPPPESGPANDVRFPPIERTELANGLELNVVSYDAVPVVYLRLVIKSGGETDPEGKAGLANLVAEMLTEGTRSKSSAELAETVEFLGADIGAGSDEENTYLVFRALAEHLDEAMDILADVARNPAFRQDELDKMKRRELDRLALSRQQPRYLAREAFFGQLYGEHPYGTVDTDPESLGRIRRTDLQRWHRTHFVPSNAFVVAVGAVTEEQVKAAAERAFGSWRGREVAAPEAPEAPTRESREVVIVDRPGSAQSTIYIGELALPRGDEGWVDLEVANQVLGGSAASRLFMDLREVRGLTYGAYSQVVERVQTGPFVALGSVRNEVTAEAVEAFFEHLDRWVAEAPTEEEIVHARDYLSDSFPLSIDTPGKIAGLVADLRIFGLADDYWDGYRSAIREVSPAAALEAAKAHVHPDRMLVVVVGRAAEVAEPLRRWGQVTVLDDQGEVKQTLEAAGAESAPAPETSEE